MRHPWKDAGNRLLLNNKKQLIGGSTGAGNAHHHHLETHIYQFVLERTDGTAVCVTTLHKSLTV